MEYKNIDECRSNLEVTYCTICDKEGCKEEQYYE